MFACIIPRVTSGVTTIFLSRVHCVFVIEKRFYTFVFQHADTMRCKVLDSISWEIVICHNLSVLFWSVEVKHVELETLCSAWISRDQARKRLPNQRLCRLAQGSSFFFIFRLVVRLVPVLANISRTYFQPREQRQSFISCVISHSAFLL